MAYNSLVLVTSSGVPQHKYPSCPYLVHSLYRSGMGGRDDCFRILRKYGVEICCKLVQDLLGLGLCWFDHQALGHYLGEVKSRRHVPIVQESLGNVLTSHPIQFL